LIFTADSLRLPFQPGVELERHLERVDSVEEGELAVPPRCTAAEGPRVRPSGEGGGRVQHRHRLHGQEPG